MPFLLTGLAVLLLSPASQAAPRTHRIVIEMMKFGPVPAGIRPGDRILWVNKDLFRHTATAKDGSFDIDLRPGMSGAVAVRRGGTIAVTCRYHPGMRALIKVSAR